MTVHNGIMLLTENDSFVELDPCKGSRLLCVLVPVSRKCEFQKSSLAQTLVECTDKIVFYTEIM